MSSSVGKRKREQQKLERMHAKAARKAARQPDDAVVAVDGPPRSEAELIDDLRELQQAYQAGEKSQEEFEEQRGHIQAQLERVSR